MKRISQAVGLALLALLALYMFASQDGAPVVTPVSFRHPELGTLTLSLANC